MTAVRRSAYNWLLPSAKDTLDAYGVPYAAWLRLHPSPDRCGCPDDRCIGHHHDEGDDCDLRYWIEDDLKAERLCGGPRTGCEQDGESEPSFGEMVVTSMWINHGERCPVNRWRRAQR